MFSYLFESTEAKVNSLLPGSFLATEDGCWPHTVLLSSRGRRGEGGRTGTRGVGDLVYPEC